MNKYSLDYFEQALPVDKIRPPYRKPAADGARLAVCAVQQGRGEETAPAVPQGSLGLLAPRLAPGGGLREAELFLQRLGMGASGGQGFAGVLVELGGAQGDGAATLLLAWRRAFDRAPLIARAEDTTLIGALRALDLPFGLLLDARGGILPVRRLLAENGLQNVWQASPVFLLAAGCPDGAKALERAMGGWHVLAADVPGAAPGALLVRRVTYPQTLAAGGAFPVRLWLQNVGNTPVYGASRFQLRLRGPGGCREIPLGLCPPRWPVGDTVYNEIAQLPGLAAGSYQLECRVLRGHGGTVPFYGAGAGADGWYPLGGAALDAAPRPELYDAWADRYPDGYYPLEDPKLPE